MPSDENELGKPSSQPPAEPPIKKRAVTLYAIIYFKLAKGFCLLLLSLFIYEQADNNRTSDFLNSDIHNLPLLVSRLRQTNDPVSTYLWTKLPPADQATLTNYSSYKQATADPTQALLIKDLNNIVDGPSIYDPERFNGLKLQPETLKLIKESPGGSRSRLNRLLLEEAYPTELSRNHGMLPQEYDDVMHSSLVKWILEHLKLHPDSQFFIGIAELIGNLTESKVHRLALGSLLLSLFPLIEGLGMLFRVSWAGWLAIGESAFFIPLELHALMNPDSRKMLSIWLVLVTNIIIVWYLYANRSSLFHSSHAKDTHPS
jgi:uncharacterized membrane protein (DUF2068 family)